MDEKTLKRISGYIARVARFDEKGHLSAILTYHGVHPDGIKNCVPLIRFQEHLDFLQKHFSVVSLEQLLDLLTSGNSEKGRYIALTFDDAYVNFLQFAYPELKKRNLPSTLFVPAGLLGSYNHWDFDHDSSYRKLDIMTAEQLCQLDSTLVEIGSHSLTHARMSRLSDSDLDKEIGQSKEILEQEINRSVKFFAYPYGELADFDERAVTLLKKYKYEAAVTTHFGRKNEKTNRFKLKRISVWDDDTVNDLRIKLSGPYDWLAPKEKLAYSIKQLASK